MTAGMDGTGAVGASYGDLLVTSLVVLGAVCVAAYIAVRFASRFLATGRARGSHLLDVVARVPLEPRRSLYVVAVAGKTLLVGTSEMGLSVLSELDGNEVRARMAGQQSFGDLVKSAWSKRRGLGPASDVSAETRAQPAAGHDERSPGGGHGNVSAETRAQPAAGQRDAYPAAGHVSVSAETPTAAERGGTPA